VSRLYYALDKLSDQQGKKINHATFYGFEENRNHDVPRQQRKGLVPRFIISMDWLHKSGNELMLLDEEKPDGWNELTIDDEEINPEDLATLAMWEKEDLEGLASTKSLSGSQEVL